MRLYFIVLISLHLTVHFITCQDGKPKFRILAPQFICGKSNEDNSTAPPESFPGITTIRLQTKAGQRLTYNWSIRFKINNGPRDQRFNLMVWRVVRSLEKTLNMMSSEIAETNHVSINDSRLIGGVDYVFNISGVNEDGVVGDTNSFSIKFTEGKDTPKLDLGSDVVHEQFSLLMLGSEHTYADNIYILEAHVKPCHPTNDYYFNWSVTDLKDMKNVNIGQQLGKRLTILPGTLIGDRVYDVSVNLYRISDMGFITSSGIYITVLKKNMSVEFSTELMTVSVGAPFALNAILKNPDNIEGTLFYDWSCKVLPDLQDCETFKSHNNSEVNFEGGLSNEGTYIFEVTVVKGDTKASGKVRVIVLSGMLPTIDLDNSPKVVVSDQAVEIQAQVSDLRPGCNHQWELLHEDGYANFDTDRLPGVFGKPVYIHSHEETFLSEIVEFGNTTFTRNFPLIIPAPDGSWSGLQPDVMYKFRLLVQCTCTPSVQCDGPRDVSTYSDVIIATNGPPVPKPIKVTPQSGIALHTVFEFSTSPALDMFKDYPLMYTFSYRITSSDVVIVNSYFENLATQTILPYSDIPLIPMLTVCDSRRACSTIDGNPIVIILPSKYSNTEIASFIDKFQSNLYRKEYSQAFTFATGVLQTFKAMDERKYGDFLFKIEDLTKRDISKQMASLDKTTVIASNEFIEAATKFIQKFTTSNDLLQDILTLRDSVFKIISQTSENNNRHKKFIKSTDLETLAVEEQCEVLKYQKKNILTTNDIIKKRVKRDVSSEDVKNFLKVSEYIILTSKDSEQVWKEKQKIVTNLEVASPDLCKKSSKYPTIIDSQLVFISFERINRLNIFTSVPYIPRVGNKLNISTVADLQILPGDTVICTACCIVKYAFVQDILSQINVVNQKGWVYYSLLYRQDEGNYWKTSGIRVMLKLPVTNIQIAADQIFQCRLWRDEHWSASTCETNKKYEIIDKRQYVVCKCGDLGYVSLYTVPKPPLEIITVIPTTEGNDSTYDTTISTTLQSTIEVADVITLKEEVDTLKSTIPNTIFVNSTSENVITKGNSQDFTLAISLSIFCLILFIFLVTFFLKRKRSKTNTQKTFVNIKMKEKGLKYLTFYGEHQMEGTQESLAKYNIM